MTKKTIAVNQRFFTQWECSSPVPHPQKIKAERYSSTAKTRSTSVPIHYAYNIMFVTIKYKQIKK